MRLIIVEPKQAHTEKYCEVCEEKITRRNRYMRAILAGNKNLQTLSLCVLHGIAAETLMNTEHDSAEELAETIQSQSETLDYWDAIDRAYDAFRERS